MWIEAGGSRKEPTQTQGQRAQPHKQQTPAAGGFKPETFFPFRCYPLLSVLVIFMVVAGPRMTGLTMDQKVPGSPSWLLGSFLGRRTDHNPAVEITLENTHTHTSTNQQAIIKRNKEKLIFLIFLTSYHRNEWVLTF